MLLQDKTIFLTGAGRGIGRAILDAAVREGATVVAHMGRRQPTNLPDSDKPSGKVTPLYGDLSQPGVIDQLWDQSIASHKRIDILINNAGLYAPSPLEPVSSWEQGWNINLQVNLLAPAALCRLAIQHNREFGEGIIINMASRSSHRGDDADHLAYGAAKGGLLALTRGIARSYSTQATLAYAVAPGWVLTEMAEQHLTGTDGSTLTDNLPLGEITPANDVAETVVFLASGRARHATGSTIDITGADYVR